MVYLQISLNVSDANRPAAAAVYQQFKAAFLNQAHGAQLKQLLVRSEDVQVLHGFDSVENARAYLDSELFARDVVGGLAPLLAAAPEVRIYSAQ
jgi:hypothetical protein